MAEEPKKIAGTSSWRKPPTPKEVGRMKKFPFEKLKPAYETLASEMEAGGLERGAAQQREKAASVKPLMILEKTSLTPERMREIILRLHDRGGEQNLPHYDVGHRVLSQVVLDELGVEGKEREQLQRFLGLKFHREKLPVWHVLRTDPLEEGLKYVEMVGREKAIDHFKKIGELSRGLAKNFASFADYKQLVKKDFHTSDTFTNPALKFQWSNVQPLLDFLEGKESDHLTSRLDSLEELNKKRLSELRTLRTPPEATKPPEEKKLREQKIETLQKRLAEFERLQTKFGIKFVSSPL